MLNVFRTLLFLTLTTSPLLAQAASKIAGVNTDESCSVENRPMKLNGAGIRSKYFIKIYVGVLCVEQSGQDTSALLAAPGAKRMQMNILYKKLEAGKITDGWKDGFSANLDDAEFSRLKPRLDKFNALFPTLHEGDVVNMDYVPERGTELIINDKSLGTIEGGDFFQALLQVWIGKHPADKTLKKGLLGK
ncbi:hypothetical protein MNBD_GAMMA15-1929 [hydrothermal vent metagenome]|uniref:Chalcone isomerase domain-containing protein n=1 Tax=hydrothermal vent metagenome TaxID=652676 RepID=A0A3B0Z355_9ZZZZ